MELGKEVPFMQPEERARLVIDGKLEQSGWTVQDMSKLNLTASLGVAAREFPTSTGPVDYALFVEGKPVGVVEAKKPSWVKKSLQLKNSLPDMRIVLLSGFSRIIKSVPDKSHQ